MQPFFEHTVRNVSDVDIVLKNSGQHVLQPLPLEDERLALLGLQ